MGDLSGIGLGPAPVAEADRPYAPDVAEEILQIAENSSACRLLPTCIGSANGSVTITSYPWSEPSLVESYPRREEVIGDSNDD